MNPVSPYTGPLVPAASGPSSFMRLAKNPANLLRRQLIPVFAGLLLCSGAGTAASAAAPAAWNAEVTVHLNRPGITISPVLYGVFYEDINYAADGGLYAELVQNRSFEYYPLIDARNPRAADMRPLYAWQTVERGGMKVKADPAILEPLHPRNPTYAVLTLTGPAGEGGLANLGYEDGIPLRAGATYDVSLYARRTRGEDSPLRVALEAPDGTVLAQAGLRAPGRSWGRQDATLTVARAEPKARLVVTCSSAGIVMLDHVSLFPRDTFKGRRNGLRQDLAQAIADLKPKTFRFPGGCIVHGRGLANAYRWKDSVGDVAHRRPNFNRWGYHQTYGLGYFEYFQFCEDIGAAPLPILPCGVSCGFEKPFQVAHGAELEEWIQDAVDLVEFANGPVGSKWGRVRAEMGHPAPFGLKYLGLGNEEHDTSSFRAVFPRFVAALRRHHPEIQIVGTSGLGAVTPLYDLMKANAVEITDEHYYLAPEWFINNRTRFDQAPRTAPKIYVGEYASRGNTQYNAVAEAVYLTGIERNSDQVIMTAYAPLLARYDFVQWPRANLIWFDQQQIVKTPNYHVQQLFSTLLGDRYLENEVKFAGGAGSAKEGPVLAVSPTLVTRDGRLVLKIVNPMSETVVARIALAGAVTVAPRAELIVLAGGRDDSNDRAQPDRVRPVRSMLPVGRDFAYSVPAMSVQILQIATDRNPRLTHEP